MKCNSKNKNTRAGLVVIYLIYVCVCVWWLSFGLVWYYDNSFVQECFIVLAMIMIKSTTNMMMGSWCAVKSMKETRIKTDGGQGAGQTAYLFLFDNRTYLARLRIHSTFRWSDDVCVIIRAAKFLVRKSRTNTTSVDRIYLPCIFSFLPTILNRSRHWHILHSS